MPSLITTVSFSIAVAIILIPQVHATETTGTLHINPFINSYMNEKEKAKTPAGKTTPPPALELRGTMIAGPNSQANIGGTILAIGDDVEGYILVEVQQRHVVLDRNGTKKMLSLDTDDREPGNTPAD
jgi:hypothetical protein